jgi:hypothetical protein
MTKKKLANEKELHPEKLYGFPKSDSGRQRVCYAGSDIPGPEDI